MFIVTKLKLDKTQQPYWAAMLLHKDGNIMLEVVSLTFDIDNRYSKWSEFEKVHNRMAKEIMKEKNQKAISGMFLQESIYDRTENVT